MRFALEEVKVRMMQFIDYKTLISLMMFYTFSYYFKNVELIVFSLCFTLYFVIIVQKYIDTDVDFDKVYSIYNSKFKSRCKQLIQMLLVTLLIVPVLVMIRGLGYQLLIGATCYFVVVFDITSKLKLNYFVNVTLVFLAQSIMLLLVLL
ncbi:hypothetical protein RZE82_09085 [Mollicutes bacterium LVI A0039]|nr:hypothetical protein RZE82_09085 [Mollicutes bacterium LVI A0039]